MVCLQFLYRSFFKHVAQVPVFHQHLTEELFPLYTILANISQNEVHFFRYNIPAGIHVSLVICYSPHGLRCTIFDNSVITRFVLKPLILPSWMLNYTLPFSGFCFSDFRLFLQFIKNLWILIFLIPPQGFQIIQLSIICKFYKLNLYSVIQITNEDILPASEKA